MEGSGPQRPSQDADQIKAARETGLEAIDGEGSFAAKGIIGEVNSGLEIEGLGRFGMTLSHPEIQRIIQSSRQARYGKGSDTIVDTSERKTWEVDASLLRFHWKSQHDAALADVCTQLGIPRGSE